MPPTPNNVDGIKPPAPAPSGPPQRPVDQQAAQPQQQQPQAPAQQPQAVQHNSVDLKAAAAEAGKQPALPRSNPKVSKGNGGPALPIVFTLIIMVALIGLAYFAYNNSK